MKRVIVFGIVLSMMIVMSFTTYSANNTIQMEIEPARFELLVSPGRASTGAIIVKNTGDQPMLVSTVTCNWDMNEAGESTFDIQEPKNDSCAGWLTFNPRKFRVEAGKQQIVRFGVTPPLNCKIGEYHGAIQFQTQPVITDQNSTLSMGNVMVTMYTALPGVQRSGRVVSGQATYFPQQKVINSALEVESLGTAHIRFTGIFVVRNSSGQYVGEGTYVGNVVFPGKKRILQGYSQLDLAPGKYTVESILKFESPLYTSQNKLLSEYLDGQTQLDFQAEFVVNKGD